MSTVCEGRKCASLERLVPAKSTICESRKCATLEVLVLVPTVCERREYASIEILVAGSVNSLQAP